MFSINGLDISVTRQDVGVFTISFSGDDAPADGTMVLVTIKSGAKDFLKPILEKRLEVTDGKIIVTLSSEDTQIPPGDYFWDARILFADDEPYTPMKPAKFTVLEAVGNV